MLFRSAKHSSSTAATHSNDLNRLYDHVPQFKDIMRTKEGDPKPVLIIIVDGGPDENPRYDKVMKHAIEHFKKRNLDAVFIACNAPGRSAFNRVERRMAPLSKELAGLILPYDFFGTHLNNRNETVDLELEKKNFKMAGQILCELWSNTTIDGYETVAEYIDTEQAGDLYRTTMNDISWINDHVHQSQYLLQVTKCRKKTCCQSFKCEMLPTLLKNGKLPPPLAVNNEYGFEVHNLQDIHKIKLIEFAPLLIARDFQHLTPTETYDLFCPSVQSKIKSRTCTICGKYFSSIKCLKDHKKWHKLPHETLLTPSRIIAKRRSGNTTEGYELLVVLEHDFNELDTEWMNEDDIQFDNQGIHIPDTTLCNINMPVIDSDSLDPLWSDD